MDTDNTLERQMLLMGLAYDVEINDPESNSALAN